MKHSVVILFAAVVAAATGCQSRLVTPDATVRTMRSGARAFDRGDYTRSSGLFKETLEDTTFAGLYNYALASHMAEDDVEAIRALDTLRKQELVEPDYKVPAALNLANASLCEAVRTEEKEAAEAAQEPADDAAAMQPDGAAGMQPDGAAGMQPDGAMMQPGAAQGGRSVELYRQAMEAYEEYLLEVPGDMDAKERYLYCKSKMPPQDQNQQGQNQDQQNQDQQNQDQQNQDQQNQDQNQNQNQDPDQNQDQDQNKDQNQDQNKDQNQDKQDQQNQQDQSQLNEQQIYQMLEAKEKQTREKVDDKKEKAILLRQKDRKKW